MAKSGRARRARSVNNSIASSASDSDGTRQITSPATPIGSRLVARTVNRGQAPAARRPARRTHRADAHSCRARSSIWRSPTNRMQRIHRRAAGLVGQAQRAGHGDGHDVGVGDRREVDVPHPVAELVGYLGRDLHRQTRLADAARAGQRHQPVVGEQPPHVDHLAPRPTKLVSCAGRCCATSGFRCAKRRELVAKVGVAQLHHPFRSGQIPQPVGAQIGQPGFGRESVDDQIAGRARQDRLAAVGQVAQPCGAVDRRADVVAFVAQLHLAGVHADAQPDRGQRRSLQLQRTRHRVGGTSERHHEAVAFTLLDRPHPVVGGDQVGQRAVEPRDRSRHFARAGSPIAGSSPRHRRAAASPFPSEARSHPGRSSSTAVCPPADQCGSCQPACVDYRPKRSGVSRIADLITEGRRFDPGPGHRNIRRRNQFRLAAGASLPTCAAVRCPVLCIQTNVSR